MELSQKMSTTKLTIQNRNIYAETMDLGWKHLMILLSIVKILEMDQN